MLRKLLSFSSALLFTVPVVAQTPVNFNANDCGGTNHDLYTELASGKVIVVSFVMPCSSCIGPTLTASNIVDSYSVSNPGQVLLYIADDAANTSCTIINNWVTTNNMHATTFSDTGMVQSMYGPGGMPKIVVFGGGSNPTIFYNEYGPASGDSINLQNAVNAALVAGVKEQSFSFGTVDLLPNPADQNATLHFQNARTTAATITLCNHLGQHVMTIFSGTLQAGETTLSFSTGTLAEGLYFVKMSDAENSRMIKIVVAH